MHGDEWFAKFKDWAKWMGFSFQIKPHKVTYRFGGGEKKISSVQEVLPIGIGKFRGYVTSQCIPESSAPLLLSLDVQRALGMILDVNRDTVDFINLGLYHLPLIRTLDGGLGVRITDFSEKRHSVQRKRPTEDHPDGRIDNVRFMKRRNKRTKRQRSKKKKLSWRTKRKIMKYKIKQNLQRLSKLKLSNIKFKSQLSKK
jgi:hypothetical protein